MTKPQWFAIAVLQVGVLLLSSCVTIPPNEARLQSIVQALPGSDPPWQLAGNASGVTVRRGGAEMHVDVGMRLLPADEITTDVGIAAVLSLGGKAGFAVLDEHTSVRLGSLEVFFGKVFADLRGLFLVRSETVEAVNDGTRYLFEVAANKATRLVMVDGTVTCRPRRGSWSAVRVTSQRALAVDYPGTSAPRVAPFDTRDIVSRYASIRGAVPAPTSGYCCYNNQVTQTMSNHCDGTFSPSRAQAESICRPAPPPVAPRPGVLTRPPKPVVIP